VDARLYSNEFEFSAMFRVTDRFLEPDNSSCSIRVFVSPAMDAWPTMADHVVDGWYAVQFPGPVPRATLSVSYELTTTTSNIPDTVLIEANFQAGKPLYECPRVATDRASFLVVYRLSGLQPSPDLAQRVACATHVSPRRVEVSEDEGGYLLSVAVESFIRIQQAHQAIMDLSVFATNTSRRLLEAGQIQRIGLRYINDTADALVPCPPGFFYSINGSYERLPLHALAGLDCYGMSCLEGYVLIPDTGECAPAAVSLQLVWVCVFAIMGLIVLVVCVLCTLHAGKLKPADQVDLQSESCPASQHSIDPFLEDEDQEFRNIVMNTYLDDYTSTLLDEGCSLSPLEKAS
jgi:hypothetical protein